MLMGTTKMTERASVVLTEEEKLAAQFLALVRGSSISGILREMLPVEIVKEYHRVRVALKLSEPKVAALLKDETP